MVHQSPRPYQVRDFQLKPVKELELQLSVESGTDLLFFHPSGENIGRRPKQRIPDLLKYTDQHFSEYRTK